MRLTRLTGTVLLLLVAGHVTTAAQEIFEEKDGMYSTRSLSVSAPLQAGERLVIKSAATLQGKLTISASTDDRVAVKYVKKARAGSRSSAIDYIDLIAVDINRLAGGAQLQLRAPNPAPWSETEAGMVEAEIEVPQDSHLEIDARYFDLDLTGPFSGVAVPSSLGRIDVRSVNGRLELNTANRRVSIADISGSISVETSNSTLSAVNIRSDGDQATFRNSGGDVTIDGFVGEISVKSSYGRIEINDFQPSGRRNVIRGRSAPIIIEMTRLNGSQVVVSNRLEDIDLTVPAPLSAMLSLAVEEDGKIEVSNIDFKPDLVQRDRLSLVAGKGDAFISGSISGRGNIYVRGVEADEW